MLNSSKIAIFKLETPLRSELILPETDNKDFGSKD